MNKKLYVLFTCVFALTLLFFVSIPKTSASSNTPDIDIATSPESVLFDISNLKPGDWANRTIIIENNGTEDFKYLTQGKLKQGSEKLYNELLLRISDKDKVLFDGKLKDFNKLDPRFLAKNSSEQLFFKVVVPEQLGNDFQGLDCEVQFKFYVDGTLGGLLPANGPKLPETGTNMYNILVTGVALILGGALLQFYFRLRRKFVKQ